MKSGTNYLKRVCASREHDQEPWTNLTLFRVHPENQRDRKHFGSISKKRSRLLESNGSRLFYFFPLHPEHKIADDRNSPQSLIEEKRAGQFDGQGQKVIQGLRQGTEMVNIETNHLNDQVMHHIKTEAGSGHIGCKSGCFIKPGFATAEDRKDGGPQITVGQKACQALCGDETFPKVTDGKGHSQNDGRKQHGNPDLFDGVLNLIMGKNKVTDQISGTIDPKPVRCDQRRIQNLCRPPDDKNERQDHDDVDFPAKGPDFIVFIHFADQHQED
jgi:hypothetical protein